MGFSQSQESQVCTLILMEMASKKKLPGLMMGMECWYMIEMAMVLLMMAVSYLEIRQF